MLQILLFPAEVSFMMFQNMNIEILKVKLVAALHELYK